MKSVEVFKEITSATPETFQSGIIKILRMLEYQFYYTVIITLQDVGFLFVQ